MYGDAKGKMSDPIQSKMDPGRKTSSIPHGWILNKRRVGLVAAAAASPIPRCAAGVRELSAFFESSL